MLLLDVKDPRIKFVTVTGVALTDDMSQAKIFVSLYGSEEEKKEAHESFEAWEESEEAVEESAEEEAEETEAEEALEEEIKEEVQETEEAEEKAPETEE